jgi:aspartate aminotransferase
MRNPVASRLAGIERSATVAMLETVQRLRAAGTEVLDLGGGEPDFATAGHVVEAATAALHDGFTHYTSSRGLPELRAAIAAKLARDNGMAVDPDTDVIVTPSAKHALFVALMTVLDPGDELIVPAPAWVSYASMARLAGARPVPAELRATDGFRLTREVLERAVTPRSRALLINTPNNPTGRVLTRAELTDIAAFAAEHDLVLIADEIYEKIIFDGREHVSVATLPGCAERTLTVNGFSKGYAMTGWRLGYLAGPPGLVGAALKVQEHTVSCASSFVQRAGTVALTGPQDVVRDMVDEYAVRRARTVTDLNALPGLDCAAPDGAFYVFPSIRGTGFERSAEFAEWLLAEAAVVVTPGSAFGPGGEGHVRLSLATAPEVIKEAVDRIGIALGARQA